MARHASVVWRACWAAFVLGLCTAGVVVAPPPPPLGSPQNSAGESMPVEQTPITVVAWTAAGPAAKTLPPLPAPVKTYKVSRLSC